MESAPSSERPGVCFVDEIENKTDMAGFHLGLKPGIENLIY